MARTRFHPSHDPSPATGAAADQGRGRLDRQVAVLCGADLGVHGIGRAVAQALAREGVDVVLGHEEVEGRAARRTADLVRATGRRALLVTVRPARETAPDGYRALVEAAVQQLGHLDLVVGGGTDPLGLFWLCRAALPHLRPGASVVATTPLRPDPRTPRGRQEHPGAGVPGLVRGLAATLAGRGVRVNGVAVVPPDRASTVTRPDRVGAAAAAVVHLAADDADQVTGSMVVLDRLGVCRDQDRVPGQVRPPRSRRSAVEPLPETRRAIDELDPLTTDDDLLERLLRAADDARAVVPSLVGLSVTLLRHGVTLTVVATDAEMAILDAVQYLDGGPCVASAEAGVVVAGDDADLDEAGWHLFAAATAARGVASTLSLPLVREDVVVGSVNLYGATAHGFDAHHQDLAEVLGAWAGGAVVNADLTFSTRQAAQDAPRVLRDAQRIDNAVGMLAARMNLGMDAARSHLESSAAAAGVPVVVLAEEVIALLLRPQDEL